MAEKVILIVGAGAAGLMAAIHAAGPGRRVILLDGNGDGGKKILISGGGRCNVLPSVLDESRYVTASSVPLMKKFLRSWPLAEQRRFFEEELGLPLVLEPETGKLFPVADSARAVRESLHAAARRRGVELRGNTKVTDLKREDDKWLITIEHRSSNIDHPNNTIVADSVVLATGGLSVPQTGSDGFGLEILKKLGHTVHPTFPALTPLTLNPASFADLAGVSLHVTIRGTLGNEKRTTSDGFLFTHRGFSGPAVLDISDLVTRSRISTGVPASLTASWGNHSTDDWEALLSPSSSTVGSVVRRGLPTRLADRLLIEASVDPVTVLAQLPRAQRLRLLEVLTRYPLPWTGDAGYQKAEVTGGGVALEEVEPKTMASRILPGLYLCGELLDAFGPIGGYNFVWAWITGRLAGRGVSQEFNTSQEI